MLVLSITLEAHRVGTVTSSTANFRRKVQRRYKNCPIDAPVYQDTEIASLSDFFAVFHSLLEPGTVFWFRGHSKATYSLSPSALRYSAQAQREEALGLIADMRRFLEMRLPRPPAHDDRLGWMQVAQHYGLPTRLLDWTQNAAVALFFACCSNPDSNGLVAIINPIELNQSIAPKLPRVFTAQNDEAIIAPYLSLSAREVRNGRKTIAVNPTWNTERIAMQQGAFTLHGSRRFALDRHQASSLITVPILRERKQSLLGELERAGIGEMFIFPEPEHVCTHLKRAAGL